MLVAVGCFVIVVLAGMALTASPGVAAAELRLLEYFDLRHSAAADVVALAINVGIGPVGAAIVAVVAVIMVGLVLRSWREAARFAVLIAVPWLATALVKLIVARPRPDMAAFVDALVPLPNSTSFPSGHTAFATALGCAVVITVARHAKHRRTVWPVLVAATAFAVLTAWSRMYLGVHQPTDVTASFLFVPVVSWATERVLEARETAARGSS